jgi:hypothetical protein
MCLAYARKATEIFSDSDELARFWSEKLSAEIDLSDLPESRDLLNTIRARTMKRGGVGYVVPDKGSFPRLDDTNRFFQAAGAIPTVTWLDGTSDGEQAIEKLLEVAMSTGSAAINVIPDRNYGPGTGDEKLKNLYEVIEIAEKLHLPVVVGTEMNSPGQKFVDDFDTAELAPLVPVFLKGAHILYAHSVLQQKCSLGYTSEWAKKNFDSVAKKNEFFEELGRRLEPETEDDLVGLNEDATREAVLGKIGN